MPSNRQTPYGRIKTMILRNEIPPDTKLNIDGLARTLGVSQTPVREALQRLEGDRLVVSKRPRGIWTTPLLDERQLEGLYEVRLLIEPWAARSSAVDRVLNPGRRMLEEIDRFLDGPNLQHDRFALASHDETFHDMLFTAVGNTFLRDSFRQLHAHLHLFRLYPADLDGTQTVEEHRAIADAVLRADPDAAESAMRRHLFAGMNRFSKGFGGPELADRAEEVRSGVLRSPEEAPEVPGRTDSGGERGVLDEVHADR